MNLATDSLQHNGLRTRALMLTLGLLAAAAAGAQTAPREAPKSAWTDAQSPARARVADTVAPIMRPPAVDTLATVRQRGVLRVGVVQVPPMVMQDRNNNYVGYSVDLARRLAADLGVRVEFVETWWTEVMPQLVDGHSDVVITGLWMNVPRALVANFTQPTASEGMYLIGSRPLAAQRRSLEAFNQPGV
ncbi:MAG: hypothetical protein AMXMBFR66_27180 [Pseudomonadota bacterium]|nr:transporter substrate-binding domain-containing protein [Comamonadaceae bacterium]